jgi:hypothetical protein
VDSNLSDLGIFSFQQVICQAKIPAILEDSLSWTSKQALSTILNNHGSHTIYSSCGCLKFESTVRHLAELMAA